MKSKKKIQFSLLMLILGATLFLGSFSVSSSGYTAYSVDWTTPQQITNNSLWDQNPEISINPRSTDQSVDLAYISNETDWEEIKYKDSSQFSTDDAENVIEGTMFGINIGSTITSSDGIVYIIGIKDHEGFIIDNSGGTFSSPKNFSNNVGDIDAAIDEDDNIHIAWNNATGDNVGVHYMYYDTSSDSFGEPVHIPDTNGNESRVTIDAWNTWTNPDALTLASVHIAFIDEDNYPYEPGNTDDLEIRYTSNSGNLNNFSTPVWVTSNTNNDYSPSIAVDKKETGVAHLAWVYHHVTGQYKVHYATSANWLAQKRPSAFSNSWKFHPDIIVDSNSIAHLVWSYDDDIKRTIQYVFIDELTPSTEFTTPIPIQNISAGTQDMGPTITRDSSDDIHVVWIGGLEEDAELYYAEGVTTIPTSGGGGGDSVPGYPLLLIAASVIPLIYIIGRRLKKSD